MAQKRSRRDYEADSRKQDAPFVVYGTPLPPLDDNARDDGSYVPLWKQEVIDDRGRKRLHGAFTGGFSAGYFNTVGSKEGWTPSTFVSSRANRAKDVKNARQQKLEDFMDEDDIREREESLQISTAEGFAGFNTSHDLSVQNVLDDVFRPSENNMGEKLLMKMGWKRGQGIGPRVRRKIDPGDPYSESREFPPQDSPMLEFSQKTDTKGLSFEQDSRVHTELLSKSQAASETQDEPVKEDLRPGLSFMDRTTTKPKPPMRSGIGVGSLNDTGSDEDDPYEMGPKVSYNRALGAGEKQKKRPTTTSTANPLLKHKPVFISKSKQLPSALTTLRKCHDGKLPLNGFVLTNELDAFNSINLSNEKYKPPEVPEDWEPASLASKTTDNHTATPSTLSLSSQPQTSNSRRRALGEQPLPSKSIFDFLSPAARDRLATATGNTNLPSALNESAPQPTASSTHTPLTNNTPSLAYPHIDPKTATTALHRLRHDKSNTTPYNDDLPKQTRYKDFLRWSADPQPPAQRVPPLRAPTHKTNDAEHLAELAEFAATAELFKPATGFLASRFTSASNSKADTAVPNNSGNSDGDGGKDDGGTEEFLTRPAEKKPSDPAEEAARMGMFGIATRTTRSWMPTRLVCKRFGVEMPIDFND
ncbi:hypothetical protein LTR64_007074 [Lithohypha guttulata]|uniref:uncharacterized protein n=1 Tax=Lithohypha guttulata TaxID=1690604 RepID=UPI002DDF59FA|nr:hypothetical protein LTR51_004370 [Lithohypha guttulata]